MIIVIDAYYKGNNAHAVGVLADEITSSKESGYITANVTDVGEYISGEFFKREQKAIEAILSQLNLERVNCILVDGYADFGGNKLALGGYIFNEYHIPVIGIAKKHFQGCLLENTEVLHGKSSSPLYVTSKGIELEAAKEMVKSMYGENRLPYLVKLADSLSRKE